MANKQLLEYVQKSLENSASAKQINSILSEQGWNPHEINKALIQAQHNLNKKHAVHLAPPTPPKKSDWNIELKSISASQILLYLGGLIVVLAGITYIGINWSQWNEAARIFAIFLPMAICYIAGANMFFKGEHKKQGLIFVVVGSLLFPIFLSVAFKELELFAKPFNDSFGLTVSFLTLVLYLGLSNVFRFPIWGFLYHAVGLFTYYYLLKILGVESLLKEPTMAWLFLIPGTAYLPLSLWYDRKKKQNEAHYSYALGILVIVFSFIRLIPETSSNDYLSWALLLFGFAYFGLGVWLESSKNKKYCFAPYLIGVGLTFFSLLLLGVKGTMLQYFTESTWDKQDIVGWSTVIIGLIYLLIAWLITDLKKIKIKEGVIYKDFFYIVGPLFTLGAVFYLGLKDNRPIHETLLLFSSIGFIFGSIPKLLHQFLYIGTLFLVIYIFSIGGEYFQNSVGWPITLFAAGLLSMGIGVAIEKARKKYFNS
jgi:hypothetical protein